MNYSDTLPRVYDVEDGYNFRLHAVPFVTLEDVQKISQEMEKFSGKLKTKVQHVVNILEQFPTRLVNIHAHNYSVPSEYVEHYCVVQAQPEGREALAHKKTDLLFLTDPLKWRLDCLKQLWEERTTVEKISARCEIKINMACVQYAMDLCEQLESGVLRVEAVDMQKMVTTTSYAIFDITKGGYVNSRLKHSTAQNSFPLRLPRATISTPTPIMDATTQLFPSKCKLHPIWILCLAAYAMGL